MEKIPAQQTSDCVKIVLFGPESTGKTTLAKDLAATFNTQWVPEYMREYLEKKWSDTKEKCTKEDLVPIAIGQMNAENEATRKVNQVLFCDTNLLEIKVYSEYYYDGYCPPEIKNAALDNIYHFYFLTYIDTPWVFDNLRDRPDDRSELFCIFEAELKRLGVPYFTLKGSHSERLHSAIHQIRKLLKQKT
ncbi:NadR type nicotinamide-nucleotide adenylyltransferase [Ulvibacter sp. MAR_2010_11]|uniref:AAA family ATPase n=1 Tax=Ulvibacter sp. MAR_2010_11 TaxID=1250229 RepID=UPI000C2CCEB1|nr:ATP-binding protein [Ulvibacter sp. MAR_2010_11]PKA82693.1 NadR type nicotinamide-nucleotide adenylyltransferase [Ulvibacter sp. MAR_2010_11]